VVDAAGRALAPVLFFLVVLGCSAGMFSLMAFVGLYGY